MSHTRMHPAELREAADNPREIRPERFEALKYALRKDPSMMEARPVILDAQTGEVVCGNMRLRAVLALGWDEVPVYVKEFDSRAQRREWMVRDNNGYGDWVPDELSALAAQHAAEDGDMAMLGFSEQELADLRAIGDDVPPPDAPEDPIPDTWAIVIDCDTPDQQAELLEEFTERGLTTRALVV